MKKFIAWLFIVLLVLLIVVVVGAKFFLDSAVKRAVETIGPRVTKVDVKLDSVRLSLLSGSGKLEGLVLGNPAGFKTPSSISIGSVSVALKPGSLLSDKIVIKSIVLEAPQITYEQGLHGNNLGQIRDNLAGPAAPNIPEPSKAAQPAQAEAAKAGRKLEVDEVVITGARLHVSVTALGGRSATGSLPDIHLPALGTGPEGITAAELTKQVLQAVLDSSLTKATDIASDLAKGAIYVGREAAQETATNAVDKVTKGLNDLFKKK
jgi:uncharacterized protein involved in outer membrane biogenesis